jgi:hypothetical protein
MILYRQEKDSIICIGEYEKIEELLLNIEQNCLLNTEHEYIIRNIEDSDLCYYSISIPKLDCTETINYIIENNIKDSYSCY